MKLVNNAPGAIQYKLDSARKGLDISKDEEKLEYIRKAAGILRTLSPVETDIYVRSLAEELKVSERAIFSEIEQGSEPAGQVRQPSREAEETNFRLSPTEANVISALLTNPDLTEVLFEDPGVMESPFAKKLENIIFEIFGSNGNFELKDINDRLEPDESLSLMNDIGGIVLAGREEEVLKESIRKWKLEELYRKQKEIVAKMDLADESEIDQTFVQSLTHELMNIQKEINKYGGR